MKWSDALRYSNLFDRAEAEVCERYRVISDGAGQAGVALRDVFPRWHSGKVCYVLPSGNEVHVKPGCRCPRGKR